MIRFYHMALLASAAMNLIACDNRPPAAPTVAQDKTAPRDRLQRIVERYWDDSAALRPWYAWEGSRTRYAEPGDAIAPQALADTRDLELHALQDLHDVSRAVLDAEAKLTYDLFRRERELTLEGLTYPAELLPINPYDSTLQRFAMAASTAERGALSSPAEWSAWRARVAAFGTWTDQAIGNLREGVRRGYVLPRILVERMLPMLAELGSDAPSNLYLEGVADGGSDEIPVGAEAGRGRRASAAAAIRANLLPHYRALHDYLEHDYLPRARDNVGLWSVPLGDAWYAYLAKRAAGGSLNLVQYHALGVAEVERLRGRMLAVIADTAFAGNAPGFLDAARREGRSSPRTAAELASACEELKTQALASAAALFGTMPRGGFELRRADVFLEASLPTLAYRSSLAFGRFPAVLLLNPRSLGERSAVGIPAQFLRETIPGRHLQIELQQEETQLPRFRRFGGVPAFSEGWALYAASLGEEMGVYRDAESKFGALAAQMMCATGMVIDTGLHNLKWSRQQALDYVHAQLPIDDESAGNLVDRSLALPGDALACTAGFLKIKELRARAEHNSSGRFDSKAFHTELLRRGALPLDLLDSSMAVWLVSATSVPIAAVQ